MMHFRFYLHDDDGIFEPLVGSHIATISIQAHKPKQVPEHCKLHHPPGPIHLNQVFDFYHPKLEYEPEKDTSVITVYSIYIPKSQLEDFSETFTRKIQNAFHTLCNYSLDDSEYIKLKKWQALQKWCHLYSHFLWETKQDSHKALQAEMKMDVGEAYRKRLTITVAQYLIGTRAAGAICSFNPVSEGVTPFPILD